MPCVSYGSEDNTEHEARHWRNKADEATRLLCELANRIPQKYIDANSELSIWVKNHRIDDERRKAKEKLEREQEKQRIQAQMKDLKARLSKLEEE